MKKDNKKEVGKKDNNKNEDQYNSEITQQEKDMLNQENVHRDGGEDDELRERGRDVDFTGEDLDIPGSDQAKKGKGNGLRDEENDLYSQGGQNNDLEEDKSGKKE